jgi:hypothetical protein
MVVGPAPLSAFGDPDELTRWLTAIGVVRDVTVEVVTVPDPRSLAHLDAALRERGYDILLLAVDPGDQWAWRRANAFREAGGAVEQVFAIDIPVAVHQVGGFLRDLVGGPDIEIEQVAVGELASALSDEQLEEVRAALAAAGAKVVFVGGHETQEQHRATIEAELSRRFRGGVSLVWFGGWGSNWNVIAAAVERELADAEALVLMEYMRTELGRTLRRAAGDRGLPWIRCSGSGRQSMQQSIEEALHVMARQRAR